MTQCLQTIMEATQSKYIVRWKEIFKDYKGVKAFVVFSHGSCVIFPEAITNSAAAKAKAKEIMKNYGPVVAGTPAGNFNVMKVQGSLGGGWTVLGWNEAIFTLVLPNKEDELKVEDGTDDMTVGVLGRNKRHLDGTELKIIHFEIK